MPNIGYFGIPADNIGRAKHFYRPLLGWKIEPDKNLDPASRPRSSLIRKGNMPGLRPPAIKKR